MASVLVVARRWSLVTVTVAALAGSGCGGGGGGAQRIDAREGGSGGGDANHDGNDGGRSDGGGDDGTGEGGDANQDSAAGDQHDGAAAADDGGGGRDGNGDGGDSSSVDDDRDDGGGGSVAPSLFEARASILGRLVASGGAAVAGATFTVTEAPAPDGSGVARGDVSAATAGDGSFRIRLTTFPDAEVEGTPPLRVLMRVDAAGVLPVFRDAWLHAGTAADLGVIKMVARDSASTSIGPAGGVAGDSANRVQVVIPPGALTSTIDVVITPFNARDELPAPLPDSTATMYGFELEPSGTTFTAPVTVRVANSLGLPTTFSIPVGFFDVSVGRWEHVGQATWDGTRFAFATTHFSTFDANAKRGSGPGVGSGPGPPPAPPAPPPPPNPCGPDGAPGDPPDPDPDPPPLDDVGSSATVTGGALNQTFQLPTYRVRNQEFGITFAYDSGLAGGSAQGAAPNDYQAVGHSGHAVSVRGLRLSAVCVPAATAAGGDRGAPAARRPGVCAAQPSCSLGQAGGIPLRADFSWAGATTTQSFSMDADHRQADFTGFIDLPERAGQVPSPGLYATHVVVNAQSPGACVSSGGAFGVSDDAQSLGSDLAIEPGPLATFDYHELVNHRLASPYGAGWTIRELEHVYRAGDVAFLARGDGAAERFRPRAYPTPLSDYALSAFRMARDRRTGETFLVHDNGVIDRIDPSSGTRTTVLSGLALSDGVHGAAVAYVGAARHFAIALASGLVDVDSAGAVTVLSTRAAPPQLREASVAARGDLVFYTDAVSGTLYRTRLSDPTHAVDPVSLASGGDVRLFPRAPLSDVTFSDPRGMDFGDDGTLYLADVQRNTVYALGPQTDGEVGPSSSVAPAVGDGSTTFFAPLGERTPGVKLAVREPLVVSAAEDGTILVVTAYGASWYDPRAREAEWLVFWAGIDEIRLNPTQFAVNAQALGPSSFLVRADINRGVVSSSVVRVDVDRLSSEFEPTRTLTPQAGGVLQLLDTTQAVVELFDPAGRIVERKRRTGELRMGFSYVDARSDTLDHVTDPVGGETRFAYDGAGRLQRVTDARGRSTGVTMTAQGDLASFTKPDLETYAFRYDAHRMTEKRSPRGDVTSYSFRTDGTLQTATKPGGQTTVVNAVLSRAPAYDAAGNIVRAGGYTDGRGVVHQVEINLRGDIEKDTYSADGLLRVKQAVYADDFSIRDVSPVNLSAVDPTLRRNKVLRVSHRTLNGVPLAAERRWWDAHSRPLLQFLTNGPNVRGWIYSADGWLRAETRGVAWGRVYERDGAGHVARIYDSNLSAPDGSLGFPVNGALVEMTYRPDGQVATSTEHTVTRTYRYDDGAGGDGTANLLGWNDALGRSRGYALDETGNPIQKTDGTTTIYATYDANNRVVETRDALQNATTYGYANAGCGCSQDNLVTSIHPPNLPAGASWQLSYDPGGRLSALTDPRGATESYAYQPTGELVKATDKLGRAAVWTHDQLGRVVSMVDPAGRSHATSYATPAGGAWVGPTLMAGGAGAPAPTTSLSAALGAGEYQIGRNAHLVDGFPAAISLYRDATFELGFSYVVDSNGRVTSRRDRTGLAIDSVSPAVPGSYWNEDFSWNVYTSLPILSLTGSSAATAGNKSSFFYQDVYFDQTFSTGSGYLQMDETLTRDAAGQVTTVTRAQESKRLAVSSYSYRTDGRLASVVNPDGTHDFTYDSRGLLATQVVRDEGTYAYGYDAMRRPSSLTYPDGHTRTQLYDELGRLTSRCYEYPGSIKRCYTAEYDAVGNPTRMTDPDGADVLEYDGLDRLKRVTRQVGGAAGAVEDYAYNALGALKGNAGVTLDDQRPRVDGAGKADAATPASVGGQPVNLDAGGRVTSLRGTTFVWAGDGTLREVDPPRPAPAEAYGVDAQGRRFNRLLGGSVTEYYVYEGLDRVATLGPSGQIIEGYLFDGIDHPLRIKVAASNTTAYYEIDLAGNVRELRASGGASLGGYRYSAFGKTIEDTASVAQPLRWKGRWYSPVAGGIYDVRARQWSPELGAFLAIDEYEYHDSESTLWGWPNQNPVRYADPTGRGWWKEFATTVIVIAEKINSALNPSAPVTPIEPNYPTNPAPKPPGPPMDGPRPPPRPPGGGGGGAGPAPEDPCMILLIIGHPECVAMPDRCGPSA